LPGKTLIDQYQLIINTFQKMLFFTTPYYSTFYGRFEARGQSPNKLDWDGRCRAAAFL